MLLTQPVVGYEEDVNMSRFPQGNVYEQRKYCQCKYKNHFVESSLEANFNSLHVRAKRFRISRKVNYNQRRKTR